MVFHFSTWTTTASLFDARRFCSTVRTTAIPAALSFVSSSSGGNELVSPRRSFRRRRVFARPSSAASYCSANSLSSRDRYASPPRRGCKVFRRPLRRYFVDRRRQCRRRRIRRSHCISSSTSRQNCYYHNANDEDDWTTQKEFNCKKANRVSFFETLVSKDSRYVLRVKNLCRNIHVGIHLHGQTDGQTT